MTIPWKYPKIDQSISPLQGESMIVSAKNIWGENSNVVKYLQKQHIPMYPEYIFDNIKSRVLKAREDEKKRLYDIERRQKHFELCGKAIKFLTDRNKVINTDFNIDNAIPTANEIAFEEEKSRRIKDISESNSFIDFNGNDNCEICRGWNGQNSRCDCGNRRVSWSSYDSEDFFLEPHIYGEAY